MNDLISRQAAIGIVLEYDKRLYEPVGTAEDNERYSFGRGLLISIEHNLKALPSAEPEIIRCKECKNWDTTWQNDWAKNYHYCPIVDGTRDGDWYCADAERRTDD